MEFCNTRLIQKNDTHPNFIVMNAVRWLALHDAHVTKAQQHPNCHMFNSQTPLFDCFPVKKY